MLYIKYSTAIAVGLFHLRPERRSFTRQLINRNQNTAEFLIKHGASIHLESKYGKTVFYIKQSLLDADKLFSKEVVNKFDKEGLSLLMKSCEAKDELSIFFLIEKGADMFIKNKHGKSAFDILNKKRILPEKLNTLKEKLILNASVTHDQDSFMGL